eukprot:TRINITY_DN12838_c0_g1_i1.p1 TRINITY_DN12838_c0_g1~~TRINITY_DN12838_c0_g1_i1.p1  ORF type:complete len:684 (+),score=42.65 TRINITY_DN12838_c0_g1_i1:35-2086(+)
MDSRGRMMSSGSGKQPERPEATTYNSLQLHMMEETRFDIKMEEITFCIPIQATNYLTAAIKESEELRKITIQEDYFDQGSWHVLFQGIIFRKIVMKNCKLQIQFTKISESNISYICNTITKSWINELRLHDCVFEGDTFNTFCHKMAKVTGIRLFEMSTNHLRNDQIEHLKKSLDKKLRRVLKLYEAKEQIASTSLQVSQFAKGLNRFTIQTLEELTLSKDEGTIEVTPNLCYAIRTSTSLKKLTIEFSKENVDVNSQWLIDAVSANRSITKISLKNSELNFKSPMLMNAIANIVANNTRITSFSLHSKYTILKEDADAVYQLLTKTSSLRNFKVNSNMFIGQKVYDAIANAPYLDSITIEHPHWPAADHVIVPIVRSISNVPKVTVKQGEMHLIVSKLSFDKLTELHLKKASGLRRDEIKPLSKKIKQHKKLTAFSLTEFVHSSEMRRFRRIFERNENLQEINFKSSAFTSPDLTVFIDCLKNNKKVASVSFILNTDCTDQLVDLLSENSTLIHLDILFNDQLKPNRKLVELALSLNNTLRSLCLRPALSLRGNYVRENTSISTLKYEVNFKITNEMATKFYRDINKILQHNTILDGLIIKERGERFYLSDPDVIKSLEKNKQIKQQAKKNTELFIRTMVARPQVYLSFLPLEIWSNIFKQISIPGVDFDFNKLLLEQFKST